MASGGGAERMVGDYSNPADQSGVGAGALPQRRAIDPTAIPQLLSHLEIVEIVEGGARFRYRLVGRALVGALGKEYTGKHLDELFAGERLPMRAMSI